MSDNFGLLQQAIERNTPIVVSMPSSGMMRPNRSRLLQITDQGVLLESIPNQGDLLDELIASEETITVTFRSDAQKVEFQSTILKRFRGHRLNANTLVEAILISTPQAIKAVQRRSNYRVTVPGDVGINFQFWRIAEKVDFLDEPPAASGLRIDVRDFSEGGCGGTWKRRNDDPPTLAPQQRLRTEIDGPTGKILLDARLRFTEKLTGLDYQRIGIQFLLEPANIQDRQKMMQINKLLGELQRMELRRKKFAR